MTYDGRYALHEIDTLQAWLITSVTCRTKAVVLMPYPGTCTLGGLQHTSVDVFNGIVW